MRAFRLFLAALIVSALAGGALWLTQPPRPLGWDQLQRGVTVSTPPGEGPFPVAVLAHGCDGQPGFLQRYVEAAAQAGVASVLLDSYGPRGIGRLRALVAICTGTGRHGAVRAGDIALLLESLDDPRLDMDRVALAGWSAGAWAVTEALIRTPPPAGVRAAFLVYPHCGREGRWPADRAADGVTVMAVAPTQDRRGNNPACLAALRRAGAEVVMVEGATHAFEAETSIPFLPLRHDAEAFAANADRFRDFLAATLAPGPVTQGS